MQAEGNEVVQFRFCFIFYMVYIFYVCNRFWMLNVPNVFDFDVVIVPYVSLLDYSRYKAFLV